MQIPLEEKPTPGGPDAPTHRPLPQLDHSTAAQELETVPENGAVAEELTGTLYPSSVDGSVRLVGTRGFPPPHPRER